MRKLFVITLGMLLAVPAIADVMPTIYGKVNREIQMKSFESKATGAKEISTIRPTDVANSETRIGVKGEYQFNDHTAKYVLELGANSSNTNTDGTLRIRHSYVDIGGFWGSFVTGQTDVAGDGLGLKLDPLSGTSAGLAGIDAAALYNYRADSLRNQFPVYGIGYFYRSRQELVGYKSPVFAGIQYYTSIDNSNETAAPGLAYNKTTVWANELSFERKFGEIDFGLYATYSTISNGGIKDATIMGGGLSVGFMNFVLSGMYSKAELTDGSLVNAKASESTPMMIAAKYTFLDTNTVAVTYGKRSNEDLNGNAGEQKDNINQLAFGYIKQLHKNVSVRASYGMIEKKHDNATENVATDGTAGFEATVAAVGTTITF